MRIASLLATAALALGLLPANVHAAGHSESNITYVDGNLTGVTPQTAGALVYSGSEALELKAGLATLAVPYSGIAKASLSAPQQHSSGVPLYKVWALPKHFSKTETQLLSVDFKDDQGEAKNMTLELDKPAASAVLNSIKQHNPAVETTTLSGKDAKAAGAPPGSLALVDQDSAKAAPRAKSSKRERAAKAEETAAAPAAPAKKDDWWGDKYWKTNRNSDQWGKSTANAPE